MNDWIIKNRIMRRLIVYLFIGLFFYITVSLFKGDISKNQFLAWSVFAGLMREILKFYLKGTKGEADND